MAGPPGSGWRSRERAGELDRGEYGDLLWRTFTRAELGGEPFELARRRTARPPRVISAASSRR